MRRCALPTGTVISDEATVTFDVNEPIYTIEVFNARDVNPLPTEVTGPEVAISWPSNNTESGAIDARQPSPCLRHVCGPVFNSDSEWLVDWAFGVPAHRVLAEIPAPARRTV